MPKMHFEVAKIDVNLLGDPTVGGHYHYRRIVRLQRSV